MRPANKRKRSGRKKGRDGGLKWRWDEHRREKIRERGGWGVTAAVSAFKELTISEGYWTI